LLESDLPNKIKQEVEKERSVWQSKFDSMTIREEVSNLVAIETPQVKKENIPNFTTAFLGFASQLGYKIAIDSKKVMRLTDSDGNPIQSEKGAIKVKDLLKTFGETVTNINVVSRGESVGITTPQSNKDLAALELLGAGFSK